MSSPALAGSPTDRIGKPLLPAGLRSPAIGLPLRSSVKKPAIVKTAATAVVLFLIVAGVLGLRLLLWLPHGVFH